MILHVLIDRPERRRLVSISTKLDCIDAMDAARHLARYAKHCGARNAQVVTLDERGLVATVPEGA